MTLIEEPDGFIKTDKYGQEKKRAIAVKMAVLKKSSSEIESLLSV